MPDGWSRDAWLKTASSRCWWYTPLDDILEREAAWAEFAAGDRELRAIAEMECELDHVPDRALRIVEGPINFLPGCGHCGFPRAYIEAVDAIGCLTAPDFIHGCYTVGPARKRRMSDYLLALDAWLVGAAAEDVAAELTARDEWGIDWRAVCADLWRVLGERTELKALLVEGGLHRQRWWLKSAVWDDDARDVFCRDRYLGDVCGTGPTYGNPEFADPWFHEHRTGRVEQIEARLAGMCPDWPWFRTAIDHSWLCAPKAFRYLECLLWSIGRERPAVPLPSAPIAEAEAVPGFLRCEDTWPDMDAAARWWREFVDALRCWWQGEQASGAVAEDVARRLGEATDVKRWLVRLLVRKLEVHERYAEVGQLVHPRDGARHGTTPLHLAW